MRYFYFLFAFVVSAIIGNHSAIGCGGDDNNNNGGDLKDSSSIIVNCDGDDKD